MCIRDRHDALHGSGLKTRFVESTTQLADKIADTNTRIDALETKFQQALHEQAVRMKNKNKELRAEWKKDIKDTYKQIADHWNDILTSVKHCLLYTSRCV